MYFSFRPGFPGLSSLPIRYLAEAQARCGVCLSTGQDPPSPCLSGDHVVFIYLALGLTVWFNGIPYVRVRLYGNLLLWLGMSSCVKEGFMIRTNDRPIHPRSLYLQNLKRLQARMTACHKYQRRIGDLWRGTVSGRCSCTSCTNLPW